MFALGSRLSNTMGFFLAFGLLSAVAGCNPRHVPVAGCLEDDTLLTSISDEEAALSSIRFVKVCQKEARLRGALSVAVMVPTGTDLHTDKIELFLDGFPIPGLEVVGGGPSKEITIGNSAASEDAIAPQVAGHYRTLSFLLKRTPESRGGWAFILGGERNLDPGISLPVGVGPVGGPAFPEWPVGTKTFEFRNYASGDWSILFFVLALVVIGFATWRTGRRAVDGRQDEATFSLSRVLTLYWFVIVFGSFLLVWTITGEYEGIITGQALLLMGIQAGTLAGAVTIDASNPGKRNKRTNPRRGGVKGFFDDILRDGEGDLRLPRAQSIAWHLILGGIFLIHVWENLWMPEFDDTLLALLGIGNGIYLGGKVGEDPKPLRSHK